LRGGVGKVPFCMGAPRQAGDLVHGVGVSGGCSSGCELVGEHSFSVRDQGPAEGARMLQTRLRRSPKRGLHWAAISEIGGLLRPSCFPRLAGRIARLQWRVLCFWGSNRSISAELRVCRGKLIWADLTRRIGQLQAVINVYIDSNVWNFLFARRIDLAVALPSDKFCLYIPREVEFEVAPIQKADLKAFIEATIAQCGIRTDTFFGLNDDSQP